MLYALIALGGILSFISARSSFFPLKMAAGFAWFGTFVYWLNADLLTDGTPEDTVVMLVLLIAGLLFLFWGIGSRKPASDIEETYSPTGKLVNRIIKSTRTSEPKQSSSTMSESTLEYRDKVRKALNRGKTSRKR